MSDKIISGFKCEVCGQWHEGMPTDYGFQLPDDVWDLGYLETYKRARHNRDFCTLDEKRYFIRGLLQVPLKYIEDTFSWGLWVEVEKKYHDLHLTFWDEGADEIPEFSGQIANHIRHYEPLRGEAVHVKLYDEHRPLVRFVDVSTHPLAEEQRKGIDFSRHHELVEDML